MKVVFENQEYFEDGIYYSKTVFKNESFNCYIGLYDIFYIKNNKLHRENGPAIENTPFSKYRWYHYGKKHRVGGPAYKDDHEECWYQNDVFYREDGPAYIVKSIDKSITELWFYNNGDMTTQVEEWIEENNLPDWKEWTDEIKIMFKLKFL